MLPYTSRRKRTPGIDSCPLFNPTEGSLGSSTLKQVKWNMFSMFADIRQWRKKLSDHPLTYRRHVRPHNQVCRFH